ncbi:hypothetical protein T01_6476 [Trichinella spiralis]|uniref:Uncharacterized protein n=1 Tax=Trichinella spiralis TaxID=6334 RepID=A0A0V0YWK1_TRISP|nr:hypothetical protein T01_6476 [Trichinella spiralis]
MKFCNFREKFLSPKLNAIDFYRYAKKVKLK